MPVIHRIDTQYMDTVSGQQREELDEFLHSIESNTRQYLKLFAEAADIAMPAPSRNDIPNDVFDVLLEQVAVRPSYLLLTTCACAMPASLPACVRSNTT